MKRKIYFQNDRIREVISAFQWYLLSVEQRKIYQLYLQHAQQERVLYIAKVKPLNMETFVSVSQKSS